MDGLIKHISRRMVAGVVALLPIGGTLLTLWWLEDSLAGTWLAEQSWYVPGLGIVAALLIVYLVGVTVTSLLGRVVWRVVDQLLEEFPALGTLYRTLKQVLGYGEGKDAIFERAVFVPSRENDAWELGLVTQRVGEHEDDERLVVFVPGSPNPTAGRLLLMEPGRVRPSSMTVNEVLTALVALGKADVETPA
jgi:uncharacterized membrane protein